MTVKVTFSSPLRYLNSSFSKPVGPLNAQMCASFALTTGHHCFISYILYTVKQFPKFPKFQPSIQRYVFPASKDFVYRVNMVIKSLSGRDSCVNWDV